MKEPEKLHQLSTPFQVNVFSSRCLESSFAHSVKCTNGELRSVLDLLQKGSHKQHLFQQHDFPFDVYESVANNNSKEQALLMDQYSEKT